MALTLYTRGTSGGSWVERDLVLDQWSVSDALNERSTATFTIKDATGTLLFSPGHGVKLESTDAGTLFNGYVASVTESRLGLGGARLHTLECHDHHYLLDKRVIADAWTSTTAGSIVQDIITELTDEGITAGSIDDGANVTAFTANYVTAAKVMAELAERSGYWWRVNPDKTLDFQPPTSGLAALTADATSETVDADDWTIDGNYAAAVTVTDALADTVSVDTGAASYRNRQWIRGGRDKTSTQTETQYGDGSATSFAVGYPVAEQPTIEVDRGSGFASETVGPAGISSGKDWYFTFGSPTITQDPTGTPLDSTDRIKVTYTGLYSVIALVEDTTEQSALAGIEGGSGIVEHVLDDRSITTRDAAFEKASNLLDYYSADAQRVRFRTFDTNYHPGLVVNVNLSAFNAPSTGLVASVEWSSQGGRLFAVVTVVSGPLEGSWARWFANIISKGESLSDIGAGEVDVVTTQESFSKTWTEAERPNIYYEQFPNASLYPDSDVVPAFEHDERVLYLAWYDGGGEVGRKAFTTQSDSSTSPIETVVLLGVNDAVGSFTHLGWWGGSTATSTVGTGIEVDKQAFAFTKTNIEAIEVTKTDTKWT